MSMAPPPLIPGAPLTMRTFAVLPETFAMVADEPPPHAASESAAGAAMSAAIRVTFVCESWAEKKMGRGAVNLPARGSGKRGTDEYRVSFRWVLTETDTSCFAR